MISEGTGLSVLDTALLRALAEECDNRSGEAVSAAIVLRDVEISTGIAPGISYEALCDLARPWIHWLPLVAFHGNLGSREDGPASPELVRVRPTDLGRMVVDSDLGRLGPFPYDLLIGSFQRQGLRVPFHPRRVVALIERILGKDLDAEVAARELGQPSFATGSTTECDMVSLCGGGRVELSVSAQFESDRPGVAVIHSLPPSIAWSQLVESIENAIEDESTPELGRLAGGIRSLDVDVGNDRLVLEYDPQAIDSYGISDALALLDGFSVTGEIELSDGVKAMVMGDAIDGLRDAGPRVLARLQQIIAASGVK